MTDPAGDPVLQRRAAIARWCAIGRRVGATLYTVAVIAFFVGLVRGYDGATVALIVGAMVVGGIVWIPAIVFGYGVKAADREDRERR